MIDAVKIRESYVVGDGATVNYWTDAHAYTIIGKTAKTLTLQRDKATLSPDFQPEWVSGGFAGHCVNQNEQTYDYERDTNGMVVKAYWSDRKCGYYVDKTLRVSHGRHEFYDYNF